MVRRNNGFGPEPIGHADILAWAMLTDSQPRPSEIRAIAALDAAFLDHVAKRKERA